MHKLQHISQFWHHLFLASFVVSLLMIYVFEVELISDKHFLRLDIRCRVYRGVRMHVAVCRRCLRRIIAARLAGAYQGVRLPPRPWPCSVLPPPPRHMEIFKPSIPIESKRPCGVREVLPKDYYDGDKGCDCRYRVQ